MLYECDLKKIIALSTLSQLGLIMMILRMGFRIYIILVLAIVNGERNDTCSFCVIFLEILLFIKNYSIVRVMRARYVRCFCYSVCNQDETANVSENVGGQSRAQIRFNQLRIAAVVFLSSQPRNTACLKFQREKTGCSKSGINHTEKPPVVSFPRAKWGYNVAYFRCSGFRSPRDFTNPRNFEL